MVFDNSSFPLGYIISSYSNYYEENCFNSWSDCFLDYFSSIPQECVECSELNGDLNLDNGVNLFDILIVINFILSDTYDDCSDFNGDDSLNVLDVMILVDIVLEI